MNWKETMRAADAGRGASAGVEARLRAEVRALGRAQRRRRVMTYAIAASVVLAGAATAWFRIVPDRPDSTPAVMASSEVTTGFYPLFYAGVPTRTSHLVRLEVPRAALASFGLAALDVVVARPSGTVLADVVIGDDGLARAVRFVHSPVSQE